MQVVFMPGAKLSYIPITDLEIDDYFMLNGYTCILKDREENMFKVYNYEEEKHIRLRKDARVIPLNVTLVVTPDSSKYRP